jgi:hypothetical protein
MNLRSLPEKRKKESPGSKTKKVKKKKLRSLSKLKQDLWEIFRHYIYKRDNFTCFTCDKTNLQGRDCQAGHFIKASVCGIMLYFDEENVHCQCSYCNGPLDGEQYLYGQKLGEMVVERIRQDRLKYKGAAWDRKKYMEMIEFYKEK